MICVINRQRILTIIIIITNSIINNMHLKNMLEVKTEAIGAAISAKPRRKHEGACSRGVRNPKKYDLMNIARKVRDDQSQTTS